MKTKRFYILSLFVFLSIYSFSQLKVASNGEVTLEGEEIGSYKMILTK